MTAVCCSSLVDGWVLDKWRTEVAPALNLADSEIRFKQLAVQLLDVRDLYSCQKWTYFACDKDLTISVCLQTLHFMHLGDGGIAHCDINNHNIMVKKSSSDPWDQIRLIDFGLASICPAGDANSFAQMEQPCTTICSFSNAFLMCAHDVDTCSTCSSYAEYGTDERMKYVLNTNPYGCSIYFSPSEQLRSYQLFQEGYDTHPEMMINGPAADFWAAGVVLFQLLTGELPFMYETVALLPKAPESVEEDSRLKWQQYETMRELHHQWVIICTDLMHHFPVCLGTEPMPV